MKKNPIIQLLAFVALTMIDTVRGIVGHTAIMANVVAGTVSSHAGSITRYAEAAFTAAHVLVKPGTASNEVLINGASDKPIGWIEDTALIDTTIPVALLGTSPNTAVLTASGDIVIGEDVFTAAAGQVQDLPVASGTYYLIGTALTAAADGEEVEVDPCFPIATVVS